MRLPGAGRCPLCPDCFEELPFCDKNFSVALDDDDGAISA
jgi:hypothetical protein